MINKKDPFIECNDIAPWENTTKEYNKPITVALEEVKEELKFLEKVINRYF